MKKEIFMKNRWCFTRVWALAVAGMMLLAGPALAQQNQGDGPGTRGRLCHFHVGRARSRLPDVASHASL
jgi:hypothetical protein